MKPIIKFNGGRGAILCNQCGVIIKEDLTKEEIQGKTDILFCHKCNNMIRVYIASPYTIGDQAVNVRRQIDCANILMDAGFAPYAPLMTHFHHMIHPREYSDWLKQDFCWIKACDCLVRLDGESKGADLEVEFAKNNNIPVFFSVDEMKKFYKDLRE